MEMNVAINHEVGTLGDMDNSCQFSCKPLAWGEEEHVRLLFASGYVPDVLVLVDVVYDPVIYQPLIDCLLAVCDPELASRQCILFVYRRRNPDEPFFALLEDDFELERLPPLVGSRMSDEDSRTDTLKDFQFFCCVR